MDSDELMKARVHYCCRQQFFHSMQLCAVEGLRRFSGDPSYRFLYGMALLLEGQRVQEAMRELEPLLNDNEVMLASILALIQAHKQCLSVDREAVGKLDQRLKEERKRAGHQALYYAALFLMHINKLDKAKEYVDRLLKINSAFIDGQVLKGWIQVNKMRESRLGRQEGTLQLFEEVLRNHPRHPEALFGKAKYLELCGLFDEAAQSLNTLVVLYPSLIPPLTEKLRLQLCAQDWEQAEETAHRITAIDSNNIEAQTLISLQLLCRKGRIDEAAMRLEGVVRELQKREPKGVHLFRGLAQLFARVCGKEKRILDVCFNLAEKAVAIDSNNAESMAELGNQCLIMDRIKEAAKFFKQALKLDESSILALSGLIACQLHQGELEVAQEQLEFLKEVPDVPNRSHILYMSAVLAREQEKDDTSILQLLNEAVEAHFRSVRGLNFGTEYLTMLNPDYVITLVKEYLRFAQPINNKKENTSNKTMIAQQRNSTQPLNRTLMILEPVTKACPGLRDAQFLTAKTRHLTGDIKGAITCLQHVIDDIDPSMGEAHLLMAQLQMQQGFLMNAQQSLEVGLSYNFQVREHPVYHLIQARVQKEKGLIPEAVATLRTAVNVIEQRNKSDKKNRKEKMNDKSDSLAFSSSDRLSIFLELADCLRLEGKGQEAELIMSQAMQEFQGTGEAIRISVANADLALERGAVDEAIAILRAVPNDQPYFEQAVEKMAHIYLHHRKDRKMYTECYRQLVQASNNSASSLVSLGDAYLSIQEGDKAVECFEKAVKREPRNPKLAAKMGWALQRTHHFGRAINYYKEALRTEEDANLRYDLAELQMKLGQLEKAEKTILMMNRDEEESNDLTKLLIRAKFKTLLADVQEKAANINQAVKTLEEAKELRVRALKRVQLEQPDNVEEQRQLTAAVCHRLAQHAVDNQELESAIEQYKESLQFNPEDSLALAALARLYLRVGDMEQCEYTCMTLLRNDSENEEATVMLADIAFRKNDYDTAMFHFRQLLQRRPDYWVALSRLVEVMRRTGHLTEVPNFLTKSEEHIGGSNAGIVAGLSFCQGLYKWYCNKPNEALKLFNKARKDLDWGQRSIFCMIQICLNPDNNMLGGEVFEVVNEEQQDNQDVSDSQQMALKTAERLLAELKPRPGQQMVSFQLMQANLLMATRHKANVEKALQDFMDIAAQDAHGRENVGAILGLATAYQLLKQTPKARNQLKRVAKYTWSFEDAEHLEKCWLLLADIYVQAGKFDMATELLRRVLQHNKSSTKAYEYMGYIMEKESSYKDAAEHYAAAWQYSGQAEPSVGFRLAFNLLKAKRYTEAIDVCHEILSKYPHYPKIRKDILDKARDNLKR